jgi:hypothetical protein
MAKQKEKTKKRATGGLSPVFWAVPLLAILDLLFYLLMSMGYISPFFFSKERWSWIAIGVQFILMAVLVIPHVVERRVLPEEEEPSPMPAEAKAPVAKARPKEKTAASTGTRSSSKGPAPQAVTVKAGKPEVVEYPEKISGGIYADSHVPIGDGKFLKLRSMIARSCLLCDEQNRCWDIIRSDIDEADFKSNTDCKEGLGIEG